MQYDRNFIIKIICIFEYIKFDGNVSSILKLVYLEIRGVKKRKLQNVGATKIYLF